VSVQNVSSPNVSKRKIVFPSAINAGFIEALASFASVVASADGDVATGVSESLHAVAVISATVTAEAVSLEKLEIPLRSGATRFGAH
jgi:hypothetical protein